MNKTMTTPLDRTVALTISQHFNKGRSAKQVFDHLVDVMHVDVTTATDAIIVKQLTFGVEQHMPAKQRILLPEYGGVTSQAAAFVIALLKVKYGRPNGEIRDLRSTASTTRRPRTTPRRSRPS